MKNVRRILAGLGLALLLFVIGALTIPPRLRKTAGRERTAPAAPPLPSGSGKERVLCIDDNLEALLWRLRVMEEAREELILSSYYMAEDESGLDIMAALLHAAERGVRVRILVDGLSEFLELRDSKPFRALAACPTVEVRVYNRVSLLKLWALNYRMHDKYLIADDRVYILGGRNVRNLSLGEYQEKRDYDRDMLVFHEAPGSGDSVHQVRAYFEAVWVLEESTPFRGPEESDRGELEKLRRRYHTLKETWPEAFSPTDWEGSTLPVRGIALLSNPIEAKNKAPELWKTLMQLMEEDSDCVIQTPYLVCDGDMYRDLEALAAGGREIGIITNAMETGANPWGCADYLNQKKRIRKTGVHVYEYLGDHSAHRKTVLVGDRLSLVGSFNFDMRSTYLDTELMLLIDSPELNRSLRDMAEENMARSRHVFPDGTQVPGEALPDRELSPGKKAFYGFIRLLILPFRPLL